MSEWISVEDRLPENKTAVLIHDERHKHTLGGPLFKAMYFANSERHWGEHIGVTHWMPLPEPPK